MYYDYLRLRIRWISLTNIEDKDVPGPNDGAANGRIQRRAPSSDQGAAGGGVSLVRDNRGLEAFAEPRLADLSSNDPRRGLHCHLDLAVKGRGLLLLSDRCGANDRGPGVLQGISTACILRLAVQPNKIEILGVELNIDKPDRNYSEESKKMRECSCMCTIFLILHICITHLITHSPST